MNEKFGAAWLLATLSLSAVAAGNQEGLDSYAHEMRIAVQGYSGDSVANFPLLVKLSESSIRRFHYSDFLSGGADVRFALADGTVLPHECERWNPSGESIFWVKVPELTPGLVLRLHYGKADDAGLGREQEVWSGYAGVWHMNLDGETVPESSHGNDGALMNSKNVTETAGAIGGAYLNAQWRTEDLPGVVVGSNAALDALGSAVTFSLWLRADGGDGYWVEGARQWFNYGHFLVSTDRPGSANIDGIACSFEGNERWLTTADRGSRSAVDVGKSLGGSWHHLVFCYGEGGRTAYLDGARNDALCLTGTSFSPKVGANWYFGAKATGTDPAENYVGGLDEIRVGTSTFSAERVSAEYAQVTTDGFLAFSRVTTVQEKVGYAHEMEITVDGYGAARPSQADYPLLVRLSETKTPGFFYADSLEAGRDLLFLLEDGTVLPHEVERWNPKGETVVWVRVPEIRQGMKLLMRYGNAGTDNADPEGAWKDYLGVWHMDIADGQVAESVHGYDGTVSHSEFVESVEGVTGGAYRNAEARTSAPGVVVDSAAAKKGLNGFGSSSLTLSCWLWLEDDRNGIWPRFLNTANGGYKSTETTGVDCALEYNGGSMTLADYGARTTASIGSISGGWHHFAVVYNGTDRHVYIDGQEQTGLFASPAAYAPCADSPWVFGRQDASGAAGCEWVGRLDEYRAYLGVESPERLAAEIAMIRTGSEYLSFRKKVTSADLDSFARYVEIVVSGYAGSSALQDFAVPVRLSPQTVRGFKYEDLRSDGRDLVFVSEDGDALDFDVACWDPAGESVVWVRIPSLVNGTKIRLYYGRSEAWFSGSGVGNVWPSYAGVWHVDETGDGEVALRDSSAMPVLTTGGANSAPAAGVFGRARGSLLTGNNGPAAFSTDYAQKLDIGSTFTCSCWLRSNQDRPDWAYVVGRKKTGDGEAVWAVQCRNPNVYSVGFYVDGVAPLGVYDLPSGGVWSKVDFVYSGTTQYVYVNGELKATNVTDNPAVNDKNGFFVGGPLQTLPGDFDEVRYSAGVRSVDWMKAEYDAAEREDRKFLTYGRSRRNGPPLGFVLQIR